MDDGGVAVAGARPAAIVIRTRGEVVRILPPLRRWLRRREHAALLSPLEKLKAGTHGVALSVPEACTVVREFQRGGLLLDDPERGVVWAAVFGAQPLSLRGDESDLLDRDIRDAARVAFEAETRGRAATDAGPWTGLEITHDPCWTPLVEARHLELDGGPAVSIIHRLVHAAGCEIVAGRVLIPTGEGIAEVACEAVDRQSGVRAALVSVLDPEARGLRTTGQPAQLQAFFDDPRHAQIVPDALSRVRRAMGWLLAPDGGALRVTAPSKPEHRGTVALEEAGCSIALPPRYLRLRGAPNLPPAMVVFARVSLSIMQALPWGLGVLRLRQSDLGAGAEDLGAFAAAHTRAWASGPDMAFDSFHCESNASRSGHRERRCRARYRLNGRPLLEIQHWIAPLEATDDGSFWRLSITIDAGVDAARFDAEMDALAASWRPLA